MKPESLCDCVRTVQTLATLFATRDTSALAQTEIISGKRYDELLQWAVDRAFIACDEHLPNFREKAGPVFDKLKKTIMKEHRITPSLTESMHHMLWNHLITCSEWEEKVSESSS